MIDSCGDEQRVTDLIRERDRERKARKAAEAVNAEVVLRRRTNLYERIESLEVEVPVAQGSAGGDRGRHEHDPGIGR
jgi:hypothetical protein